MKVNIILQIQLGTFFILYFCLYTIHVYLYLKLMLYQVTRECTDENKKHKDLRMAESPLDILQMQRLSNIKTLNTLRHLSSAIKTMRNTYHNAVYCRICNLAQKVNLYCFLLQLFVYFFLSPGNSYIVSGGEEWDHMDRFNARITFALHLVVVMLGVTQIMGKFCRWRCFCIKCYGRQNQNQHFLFYFIFLYCCCEKKIEDTKGMIINVVKQRKDNTIVK